MGIVNSNVSYSGLVEKYIGTAYDNVKTVADNIEYVIKVGEIEGIEDIADDIAQAIIVVTEGVIRAEAAAESAEASSSSAASSAASANSDASSANAAALQTAADVTTTNQNANKTAADVVTTNNNVVITNQNAASSAADAEQTASDVQQTQQDVVTTASNAASAGQAAIDAESAWDEFNDFYIGAFSDPPTEDNDGNALIVGALYLSIVDNPMLMKFWNGSTWLNAFSTTDELNHSALIGLSNDDHPQYLNDARHDLIEGNPHGVTKSEVGLGNCDNTSDVAKPISALTQVALDDKVDSPSSAPAENGYSLISTIEGITSWAKRITTTDLNNGLAGKENSLGVPATDGRVLASTIGGVRSWIDVALNFIGLTDTPASYTGQAGKAAIVNQSEDGMIFSSITAASAVGTVPPGAPSAGASWLNSDTGQLYTWYVSPGNGSSQWVKDNTNVK